MSILNNAVSASLAFQAALDVTSQNIANVMTPGYTRQGVQLSSVIGSRSRSPSGGDGVEVASLIRFSDSYKTQQLWRSASELAHHTVAQPYLEQLEQVMADDAAGLDGGLDAFFAALNAASVEPSSGPLRQQVIGAADALALRFGNLSEMLANQRASVVQQRDAVVAQINSVAADIATLNEKIVSMQANGVNPSSLVDARDLKIDALASLVAVQVVDRADGSLSVSLRSGAPLVVGSLAGRIEVTGLADGSHVLGLTFAKESFAVAGDRLGGQLGGLEDYESGQLLPLRRSIVEMAQAIADGVNTTLANGFAPDGSAGVALFAFDATGTTGLLRVVPGVRGQDLGFSSDPAKPGNSDVLMSLIGLKQVPIPVTSLGSVLLGDASTQLVGRLGMDSQQNQAALMTAQAARDQADAAWKSTSGVNQDEEAISLIQYQQAYQANLKVIAVANELFDSTLAML